MLSAFTGTADIEGRALAIMQQHAADNVKNVVAADAFGSAGEGNVADLLQRLPGITVSYTSADPDQVSIRGVSPEMSTVTVDGAPVANAAAGTARTFRFTITSNISMLESVEVTKALTPEMDAASVGGAINLRSKTPFQSKVTRSYDFQIGGNLESRSDSAHRMHPNFNARLTRVFGTERRLGVTLAANYTAYHQIQDQVGYTFNPTLAGPAYVTRFFYNDGPKITFRSSASGRLDYELSKRWTIYGSASANYYRSELANKVRDWTTAAAAVAPGYSELVTEALVSPSSATSFSLNNSLVLATSVLLQTGGRNRFDTVDLDYDFSYSPGKNRVENVGKHANLTGNITGVGWRLDRGPSTQYPAMRYTGGPDPQNLDNYGTLRFNTGRNFTWDNVWSGRANAKKSFATRWPVELKVGGVMRGQERDYNNTPANFAYVGADGVAGRNAVTGVNDDQFGRFLETEYHRAPTTGGYPSAPWPSAAKLAARFDSHPGEFQLDTYNNLRTKLQSLRNARIQGIEFACQQQFTFLPGWFRGLGMFANYTRLQTEGDYGSTTPRTTSSVPGFVPRSANVGVSYSIHRVSLRAKWNYKSLALFSYSTNPASLRYNPGQGRIDLSARYKLTRHLDLYGDAINVTAVPMVFQGPMPGCRDSISDYGAKVSFGLSGRY